MLASFPSNELNTPPGVLVLVAALLLVALLYCVLRTRSFFLGLVVGATAFALIAGYLSWPRVIREPRAPNPGPVIVIMGAILGGCLGATSALLGKAIHRFVTKDTRPDGSDRT